MGWRIVVRHPCHATTEPIFVTKNGYGDMVLMSMETYEAKMQMLEIHTKLAQAEEQIRAGQVRPAEDALQELAEEMEGLIFSPSLQEMCLSVLAGKCSSSVSILGTI